jgi:hypothetical protein
MKSLLTGAERSPNFCASIRAAAAKRVAAIDDGMATLAAQRAELVTFISACAAKAAEFLRIGSMARYPTTKRRSSVTVWRRRLDGAFPERFA